MAGKLASSRGRSLGVLLHLVVICSLLSGPVGLGSGSARASTGLESSRLPVKVASAATFLTSPRLQATAALTVTADITATLPPTDVPLVEPTPTLIITPTATALPFPTLTVTPTATASPLPTLTITPTATASPTPTLTVAPIETAPLPTLTVTPTVWATPDPAPVLSLSMAAKPETAAPGDLVTFTLVVSNGGSTVAQGLVISDCLPEGLEFAADSAPGASYDPKTGTVVWGLPELEGGEESRLSFSAWVTASLGETVVNGATLTAKGLEQVWTAKVAVYVTEAGLIWPDVGGVFQSDDGRVAVGFPPGAVTRPIEVSHRRLPPLELAPDRPIFYRFELTAWEAEEPSLSVSSFARPVTVTLTYSEAEVDGLLENRLRLVYHDEATGVWVPLTATLNVTDNVITAQLGHFSDYGLEGEEDVFFQPRIESGQVNLFGGDSSFSYALDVPAGAGGLSVPLVLRYSGGSPNHMYGVDNTDGGWVGVGWTLDVGSIGEETLTLNGVS